MAPYSYNSDILKPDRQKKLTSKVPKQNLKKKPGVCPHCRKMKSRSNPKAY